MNIHRSILVCILLGASVVGLSCTSTTRVVGLGPTNDCPPTDGGPQTNGGWLEV
jgi:hypothetical protein